MRSLTLLLCVLSLSAVAIAGCGSAGTASSADSVAPAGAVMYGEVSLSPEGGQKQALDTLVAKFPGEGSLEKRIRGVLEDALAEADQPLSYEKDVEPWLGDEAGFFVQGAQLDSGAAMIAADDEDAAREALEKAVKGDSRERSYKDVDYLVSTGDDTAGGVVDGFLIIGTERALKTAIDTSDGGSPLADDETFGEATGDIPEERLGFVYLNSPKLFQAIQGSIAGGVPLGSLRDLFNEPYVTTMVAENDGVVFESDAPESLSKVVPFLGKGSELVRELPGDSWLALAQPELGKLLEFYVDAFASSVGGREVIEDQLLNATGLRLGPDVLDWMGDFGLFVRGTSVADLNGGLVVETTDPAATERFLGRLARLARAQVDPGTTVGQLSAPGGGEGFTVRDDELPQPIHLVLRGDRFVIAYGDAAAADAFDPASALADAPAFSAAAGSLKGYDTSFFLDMAAVLSLIDSTEAASDPQWQQVRPYLEPLTALVGGSAGSGNEISQAFKVFIE